MERVYNAILRGDRVEWIDEVPEGTDSARVQIVLAQEEQDTSQARGEAMARALEALADRGGIRAIAEPGDWQREVREDRPLPYRE